MRKLQYRQGKTTQILTSDGKTIPVTEIKTISVNAPCKSCKLRQRKDGSSRCGSCSTIGGILNR